ncbi:hypothetical protein FOXYS1_13798 [Fusarium oxysporum]|uniref:Uncharacterized protein n=1 Tax=Fusarium oxysporum TaxID=5507 RepID=A0A8H5A1J2_FUSOX|nr:hypothetical protein FOXYS1_13798 [Fusarium oxysporum]
MARPACAGNPNEGVVQDPGTALIPNVFDNWSTAGPVEKRQDHPAQETRQGRLLSFPDIPNTTCADIAKPHKRRRLNPSTPDSSTHDQDTAVAGMPGSRRTSPSKRQGPGGSEAVWLPS